MAAVLLAVVAFAVFQGCVWWWPYPQNIDRASPAGTWIEDRNGTPLAALVAGDDQWRLPLTLEQVSPQLLDAIVAVEDCRFYTHGGVDWKSVLGAAWEDVTSFRLRRGASTITMQVHRLRNPRPRTFFNKFEQAVRACQIERQSDKKQIVVEYINRAPFGGNLVGAGAASWRYFGRPCRELSLAQAALLAGLPQNPKGFRPDRYPDRARLRRDHVLDRMLACGMISANQHDEAKREPLDAAWRPLPQDRRSPAPAADGALPTLTALAARYPGQKIVCSLDAAMQHQAAVAAEEHLQQLRASGANAIAVVVLDTLSAECRAVVSLCREAADLELTARPRSTGSVLKPLIYAGAFDAGICSPATILHDSPQAWPGYVPSNYDRQFRGDMTAAAALAESRNIPAMVVLSQLQVERAAGLMGAAGLRTLAARPQRYGLSLAIGGAEATPMEVAEAYATLGRMGTPKRVSLVSPIDSGGADVVDVEPTPLLRAEACLQTLAAISDAARTMRVCPEAAKLKAAWKTGTSSGNRDAWCAAMTPRRVVVVWLGNVRGEGSRCLVGQEAAAPLALRLLAAMDGGGEPWPAAPASSALADASRAATGLDRSLTLVRPTSGQQFILNRDQTAESQRILLQAAVAGQKKSDAHPLWWFVDNQPLGESRGEQRMWWDPEMGTHEVRVMDDAGHSARVRIHVR